MNFAIEVFLSKVKIFYRRYDYTLIESKMQYVKSAVQLGSKEINENVMLTAQIQIRFICELSIFKTNRRVHSQEP